MVAPRGTPDPQVDHPAAHAVHAVRPAAPQLSHIKVLYPGVGFLSVPLAHVRRTNGIELWRANDSPAKKDLSLCCLFQKGKCNLGAKCHQVHADRQFVEPLRRELMRKTTCCAHCGDEASRSPTVRNALTRAFPSGTVLVSLPDETVERIPVERLGWTQRLQSLVEGHSGSTPLMLQWSRVCRLHQQSRCHHGSSCKNVHICHDADLFSETSTQGASEAARSIANTPKLAAMESPAVTPAVAPLTPRHLPAQVLPDSPTVYARQTQDQLLASRLVEDAHASHVEPIGRPSKSPSGTSFGTDLSVAPPAFDPFKLPL